MIIIWLRFYFLLSNYYFSKDHQKFSILKSAVLQSETTRRNYISIPLLNVFTDKTQNKLNEQLRKI